MEQLISALRSARSVAVLTGAGISAESGIPTFRDALTGLWAKYDPMELATPAAFARDPKLVWEWYAWRRELVAQAKPNAGHYALVELERLLPRCTLITQNVDGFHRLAGSQSVIELHGNINQVKCSRDEEIVTVWPETAQVPPPCPQCGAPLRPDVVWFGEPLPVLALHDASRATMTCDVFLSIGTSGMVEPAASLPWKAREHGALVAIINPDADTIRPADALFLQGPAGQILPQIVNQLKDA